MVNSILNISEIFYSIQGESLFAGKPTVFVRTMGCKLRCTWCDTQYAYDQGQSLTIDAILSEIEKFGTKHVCITGGEPLLQDASLLLMRELVKRAYVVSLETGGSVSVQEVPRGVTKVIDVKCPDSGETEKMAWENLELISRSDQLKFVIASQADFGWALKLVQTKKLHERCCVLLSPAFAELEPHILAQWILEAKAPVTMQLQLHKYISEPPKNAH